MTKLLVISSLLIAFNFGFIIATQISMKLIESQLKMINHTLNDRIDVMIVERKKTIVEIAKESGKTSQSH